MPIIAFQRPDGSPATIGASTHVSMHAFLPHPGEIVALREEDRPFKDEEDAALRHALRQPLAGRPLTVARTIVVVEEQNAFAMLEFEGVTGRFAAAAFTDSRPVLPIYGVMTTIGDDVWLVAMDEKMEGARNREVAPMRITAMERPARHQLMGTDSPGEGEGAAVAAFAAFANEIRDPISGEFHVVMHEDGTAALAGAPWSSGCSEQDIRSLYEAVDEATNPVTLKSG